MECYTYFSLTVQATLDYRERTNEVPLKVKRGKSINFREPLPNEKTINVPQIKQEQSNWCWAACTEMVLHYYGGTTTRQCDFVNELFDRTECCLEPSSPNCNRPCGIQDISNLYSSKHIHNKLVDKAVPFSKLQSEIDANRPVEVVYFWRDWEEPGHSVIVHGWRTDGKGEFVHVNDPADSPTTMSGIVAYSELLVPYGKGDWTYTWIEIRR